MNDTMKRRVVLASLLISLLLLLSTCYYLNHEQHEEYPGKEEVIRGFEGKVSIDGEVINKSSDSFYILIKRGAESRILEVKSGVEIETGDRVEVLGILYQDEIVPERMIVYKKWSHRLIFIRSAIAIPIVAYIFLRYWTFDLKGMRFRRREDA
jgi:hypothetical protein